MPAKKKTPSTTTTRKKTTARKPSTRTSSIKTLGASREPQRAIFIDVENTSSEEALLAALNDLGFEGVNDSMQVVAVGNWRVIGAHVARMLAQRGARLVHTAPATGVKDWSDLSIAVAAGIWLGRAKPRDQIEIVSADRAFDAVGDAAAALGVTYRRVSYASVARLEEEPSPRRRTRRGGRRRRRPDEPSHAEKPAAASAAPPASRPPAPRPPAARPPASRPPVSRPPSPPAAPPPAPSENHEEMAPEKDIHAAPPEEIIATLSRLIEKNPERGVNLDLLISALKSEGYGRPPGSPRLVTRLRMLKDVEVSPTGMVRLVTGAVVTPPPPDEPAETEATAPPRRPRRRGGRRRRSGKGSQEPEATVTPDEPAA